MGTITLTLPVAGQDADAGPLATNFSDLQTLLNGNLDGVNISASAVLDATARVGVRKNSAGSTFSRRRINFIEGTGVTLTVADDSPNEEVDVTIASAGGVVATTVAGLGTAVEGKLGMLRIGSTPYDFVQLVYDGTLAKWVSRPVEMFHGLGFDGSDNNTIASGGAAYSAMGRVARGPVPNIDAIYDTGLRLQVRAFMHQNSKTAAGTAALRYSAYEFNDADATLNSIGTSGDLFTWTLTTAVYKQSAWIDVTIGSSPTETHGVLALDCKDSGTATFNIHTITGQYRWVSA